MRLLILCFLSVPSLAHRLGCPTRSNKDTKVFTVPILSFPAEAALEVPGQASPPSQICAPCVSTCFKWGLLHFAVRMGPQIPYPRLKKGRIKDAMNYPPQNLIPPFF